LHPESIDVEIVLHLSVGAGRGAQLVSGTNGLFAKIYDPLYFSYGIKDDYECRQIF
jgi:hypothetical protein